MKYILHDITNSKKYKIEKETFTIGRNSKADIIIDSPKISSIHCEISYNKKQNSWYITDLNSTNGTFLSGIKLKPEEENLFSIDNDTIRVFNIELIIESIDNKEKDTNFSKSDIKSNKTSKLDLDVRKFNKIIKIGRSSDNDICIKSSLASRYHAEIITSNNESIIKDLSSKNGTFVNGKRISKKTTLYEGDIINIADYSITFSGSDENDQTTITVVNQKNNLSFDVINLSKTVIDKDKSYKKLLDNICFNVKPGEFVVVLGGSGAGKSTLLDALNGFRPANEGKIYINGMDYYNNLEVFKPILGYVPQKDIVHEELTVFEEIDFAAKLRLGDLSDEEREKKVNEVIDKLGLSVRKNIQIRELSGGQKKRVSIGIELLSEPSLFFLDEPTSGLDPATERDLMILMKDMAKEGKIVFLITHAISNLDKATHILFLGNEGRVVYFGPSGEILNYFDKEDISDVYDLVKTPQSSVEYNKKFLKSKYYLEYVYNRSQKRKITNQENFETSQNSKNNSNLLNQYITLTARYATTVWKDKGSLSIQLLQAPIISILIYFAFDNSIFSAESFKNKTMSPLLLFIISSISIWFGTSNSAQEIIKEIDIFKRERMINLRIMPYIFSKLTILIVISIIQCFTILIMVNWYFNINSDYFVEMFFTILLGSIAGNTLGLLISSLSFSKEMAVVIVPLVLIPQIMFSGAITKISDMSDGGKFISYLTINKWLYHGLGDITDRNSIICGTLKDTTKKVPPEELGGCGENINTKQKYYNKNFIESKIDSWSVLVFMSFLFLMSSIIALFYRDSIISILNSLFSIFR